MRRKWPRLVSLVSLAAYLFANTHAGPALAAQLHSLLTTAPAASPPSARGQGDTKPSDVPRCKHCARLGRPSQGQAPRDAANSEDTPQGRSCPCQPGSPSCPCCPGPCGPKDSCPCPGGCALCSVAKVPCLSPFALFVAVPLCVGESPVEVAPLYISPCCAGLIRPPRA